MHSILTGFKCHAGYMPSDLYNLNSAYGTKEELKHCIAEMHAHDLLVHSDSLFDYFTHSADSYACEVLFIFFFSFSHDHV